MHSYTTRWLVIGIVTSFAIGGLPGLAVACEGTLNGTVTEDEETKGRMAIINPYSFNIKITVAPFALVGAGTVTSTGTCTVGKLLAAFGGSCTYEQNHPLGSLIDWVSE
jgi:hypothetical protein